MFYFYKIVSGQQDGSEGNGMSHQFDNLSTAHESTITSYPMTSTFLAW